MQYKTFLTFWLFSGQGKKAVESLNATFVADIYSKAAKGFLRTIEDDLAWNYKSPYNIGLETVNMTEAPPVDVFLTSAPIQLVESVLGTIKKSKPSFFIWDIGNKYLQASLKRASAVLEFNGYDLMFIKDSSTRLGIPYNDTRYILIGKRDADLILLPSRREKPCLNSLDFYFNTNNDPELKLFEYKGVSYHEDVRPWSHVAFPEDGILPEKTLGWKYGATYYIINDKVHRITAPECSLFLEQSRLNIKNIRVAQEVFLQFREMPYLMWIDYLERMI